jgi:ribonuclease Z
VLDQDGLRIRAIKVDHAPIAPAYAYRFDYKGRSVLVTGDLKFHAPLVASARGVAILVSEAIAVSMTPCGAAVWSSDDRWRPSPRGAHGVDV